MEERQMVTIYKKETWKTKLNTYIINKHDSKNARKKI